jgi:hypothetical protein
MSLVRPGRRWNIWAGYVPMASWVSAKCCRITCGSRVSPASTKWASLRASILPKWRQQVAAAAIAVQEPEACLRITFYERSVPTPTSRVSPHTAGPGRRNVTCPELVTCCLSCWGQVRQLTLELSLRPSLLMEMQCSWGTSRTRNGLTTRKKTTWICRHTRHPRWETTSVRPERVCSWTITLIAAWHRLHRRHLRRHATDPLRNKTCHLTTVPQTQAPFRHSATIRNNRTGAAVVLSSRTVPCLPEQPPCRPTTTIITATTSIPCRLSHSASEQKQWSRWSTCHREGTQKKCRLHHLPCQYHLLQLAVGPSASSQPNRLQTSSWHTDNGDPPCGSLIGGATRDSSCTRPSWPRGSWNSNSQAGGTEAHSTTSMTRCSRDEPYKRRQHHACYRGVTSNKELEKSLSNSVKKK